MPMYDMALESLDYRNILFSPVFSKLIIFILIVGIGIIIARVLGKIIYELLHDVGLNKMIKRTTHLKISLERIISRFVVYFIYLITLITALTNIGVSTTALNIIIAAISITIILALFFVIKDFFPNIIASILIQKKDIIKPGDYIEIEGATGIVKEINSVETIVQSKKKKMIYMPNSLITKSLITIKRGAKK